jgi:hypothetical protein
MFFYPLEDLDTLQEIELDWDKKRKTWNRVLKKDLLKEIKNASART